MASRSDSVWAIDIGNSSLKALRLTDIGGKVEVTGFDNVKHGKILSGGGVSQAEKYELVAISLREFVKNHNIGKDDVIVSVPSQNTFARFVKLPPVEKKKLPEIVNFEAAQQIPFDINDVQWDWQLMDEGDSPEMKVGLFAIKNEVVTEELDHFTRENIKVTHVQMSPMALYNYLCHDRPDLVKSNSKATVVINIGAEITDLVVCTHSNVWQRCIPMGGNAFTRAIAETFKLKFAKAEKLKRTAAMSKYARQILQAMKPVFTDLASEIQRSLGFYASSNPGVRVTKIVAMGGGTKMRGLLKYLEQTLQIPISRPDSFKRAIVGSEVSAAEFHENVSDFGIVYGLGLQALEYGKIESNLLPKRIARSMAWASKTATFTAAACLLLLAGILGFVRVTIDKIAYEKNESQRRSISRVISDAENVKDRLEEQQAKGPVSEAKIQKEFDLFKYRDITPQLWEMILSNMPNEENAVDDIQRGLYKAFNNNDVEKVRQVPRKERKQIFITGMSMYYTDNVETEAIQQAGSDYSGYTSSIESEDGEVIIAQGGPGFVVSIAGYSPYEKVHELFDPVGISEDRSNWGVITRLMDIGDPCDMNSPIVLYKKGELGHYRLSIGEVVLGSTDMPPGIGVLGQRNNNITDGVISYGDSFTGEEEAMQVLIDPMTKEIISKIEEVDEEGNAKTDRLGKVVYQVNDHWFYLTCKFSWRGGPAGGGSLEEEY